MAMGEVRLRRGQEAALNRGSLRIYDNQVSWVDEACRDGEAVQVTASDGTVLGTGFFNSRSKILVRLLTRQPGPVSYDLLHQRICQAWQRRQELGFSNACRVVFGEADGLPGLTVDKFGDYLSLQIVCLGMAAYQEQIVQTLVALFHPLGICQRNDLAEREKEGLERVCGCIYGEIPEQIPFLEHDAHMTASLLHGQKTGHYLDQQENRGKIAPCCPGRTVLDLCCHTGGFSIHAALYGAKAVTAVDVSQDALTLLAQNAERNGVADVITTVKADVFSYVDKKVQEQAQFGLVICDPPAFAKSRSVLESAYRGYRTLNTRCMQLTSPGGYLASFSCSQYMTDTLFFQMLQEAAERAGRRLVLMERLLQSRDHPAALYLENSFYLKGCLVQVL